MCHAKTWPHVYHFCRPANKENNAGNSAGEPMVCEVCDKTFTQFRKYRSVYNSDVDSLPLHVERVRLKLRS